MPMQTYQVRCTTYERDEVQVAAYNHMAAACYGAEATFNLWAWEVRWPLDFVVADQQGVAKTFEVELRYDPQFEPEEK